MTTADLAAFAWIVYLIAIMLLFLTPYMALSITMSLRGIHRELKRMNGVLKPSPEETWRPADEPPAQAPAPSMGHQLLR